MALYSVHYGPFRDTFSQVVQATTSMARSFSLQPEIAKQNFYFNICQFFQEKRELAPADWDAFDRAFSKIGHCLLAAPSQTSQRAEFLKWVYQIETRASRRFKELPDTFKPVLVKGPELFAKAESKSGLSESQEGIASDARLLLLSYADFPKETPLIKLVASDFKEAQTPVPEVDFSKFSAPGAFAAITAFLQHDESFVSHLSQDNLEEVMNFAKMYELDALLEGCMNTLQEQLKGNDEPSEQLEKLLSSLICLTLDRKLPSRRRMRQESSEGMFGFNTVLKELRTIYSEQQKKNMAPEKFEEFSAKARGSSFLQNIALEWVTTKMTELQKKGSELTTFFSQFIHKALLQKENDFLFPLWNLYLELKQKQKFDGEMVLTMRGQTLLVNKASLKDVEAALHFAKNLQLMQQLEALEIVLPFQDDKLDGEYFKHILDVALFGRRDGKTKKVERMPRNERDHIPKKITFVLSPKDDTPLLAPHGSESASHAKLVKECSDKLEEYRKSGSFKEDIASRTVVVQEHIRSKTPIDFSIEH